MMTRNRRRATARISDSDSDAIVQIHAPPTQPPAPARVLSSNTSPSSQGSRGFLNPNPKENPQGDVERSEAAQGALPRRNRPDNRVTSDQLAISLIDFEGSGERADIDPKEGVSPHKIYSIVVILSMPCMSMYVYIYIYIYIYTLGL